jgi:hypothetical protein
MIKSWSMATVFGFAMAAAVPAQAIPIYMSADFSGGVSTVKDAVNALGLQKTSTCSGCAAGSVTGHLLFDTGLIPAAESGLVSVPLASVPGAANGIIFDIVFGNAPLEFQFGDSNIQGGPSIQFQNGVFNGLNFVEDFSLNGSSFELSMQGGSWNIKGLKNGNYADLAASGYINVGNTALTHQQIYQPVFNPLMELPANSVPEPATLTLLALGLVGISATCRRKMRSTSTS